MDHLSHARDKLNEAKYFLDRLSDLRAERDPFRYNLSAFLASARSVTWMMQKEYSTVDGFREWYEQKQAIMHADTEMKFLDDQRDKTVHMETLHPRAHVSLSIHDAVRITDSVTIVLTHADGSREVRESPPSPPPPVEKPEPAEVDWRWYFERFPERDIVHLCREYWQKLEAIVVECEALFGEPV